MTTGRPKKGLATFALVALAFLLTSVAGASPALAHPGHAVHASGGGWLAPTAVGAGVAVGVAAVHLRVEGVVAARTAAVGGTLGLLSVCVGVGAFAGVVPA